jgi:hypothetical protein
MLEDEAPSDFNGRQKPRVKVATRQACESNEDALAHDNKWTKQVVPPLPDLPLQPRCALLTRERATQPSHDALVHTERGSEGEIIAADRAKA